MLGNEKRSSLFFRSISGEEKSLMTMTTVVTLKLSLKQAFFGRIKTF